jgi:CubicO group peptidase (beta-lactamase class C family)
MDDTAFASPEKIGLSPSRLNLAYQLLEKIAERRAVPGAALCVGRHGRVVEPRLIGRQSPHGDASLRKDALFLIASITKPVTATAVMLLVERGKLKLDDRVAEYIPAFAQNGKADVRIRHLLTHTSGLPDMVPANNRLRAEHRPLAAFIDEICKQPLLFEPGTQVSYQSAGIAMLAEVVHQVEGVELAGFLHKEVFEPLAMNDTSLGWRPETKERIAVVRQNPEQERTDWHWNTPYWLGFGAPWGGLITSPTDFARFCLMWLGRGTMDKTSVLSRATVRAMTTNQLAGMSLVPEQDRRCRPWGLGWRLNWPGQPSNFGDLVGPRAFGHWGASGTLCWIDPEANAFFILFTTQPQGDDGPYLARVSNLVAAACE